MLDADQVIDGILAGVRKELARALTKHPTGFHSGHEGWAVILEEVQELFDEVKIDKGGDVSGCKEAIQVAAMGVRYVLDVCGAEVIEKTLAR